MSWSFMPWSWQWFLAIEILLGTAWLLTRHRHKYEVAGVSYPPPPVSGVLGLPTGTAPFVTQVLYACKCQQPCSAISVELSGHWVLDQVKGLVRTDEPVEGGEADGTGAKVTTLVPRGADAPQQDK